MQITTQEEGKRFNVNRRWKSLRYVNSIFNYFSFSLVHSNKHVGAGNLIFVWLLSQSTDCESPSEYNRSHQELSKFLQLEETRSVLSDNCINAVVKLQDNLRSKEYKLAGYHRIYIPNCMDACTTSPVESNNNAVKHGPSRVNARRNLDETVNRLIKGINTRFSQRNNKAKREVNRNNTASCAPTSDYFIEKGQGLIDRYHDHSHECKSATMGTNEFIVTDWSCPDNEQITSLYKLYQPKFYRARKLNITKEDGIYFVWCSCGIRQRVGVPCPCFFAIARSKGIESEEIIDLGMVEARYLKLYNAHYGEDSPIGKNIHYAQQQCVLYQDLGTQISESFAEKLLSVDDNATYPILGSNTSPDDIREAMYVLGQDTTTRLDMAMYRMSEDSDCEMDDDLVLSDLKYEDRQERVTLTHLASKMKSDISESIEHVSGEYLPTDSEIFDMKKDWSEELDKIMKDDRGSKEMKSKVCDGLSTLVDEYWDDVTAKYGMRGGGKGKTEIYGIAGGNRKDNGRHKRAS